MTKVERHLPADPPADLTLPPPPVSLLGVKTNGELIQVLVGAICTTRRQLLAWREWWAEAKADGATAKNVAPDALCKVPPKPVPVT